MTIKHVFKNGTTTTDITGRTVKRADCPRIYEILERTNESIIDNCTHKHSTTKNGALRSVSGSKAI